MPSAAIPRYQSDLSAGREAASLDSHGTGVEDEMLAEDWTDVDELVDGRLPVTGAGDGLELDAEVLEGELVAV